MVGLGERDHPANVACLVLSLLPLLPGPISFEHKGQMADSCQEIPKNKIWVRGSAKAKKGLKMGMGKGHRDRVLWQRRRSKGRPVLETTWEN